MAVSVVDEQNKHLAEYEQLRARAKAWKQTQVCRHCGSSFTFDATDFKPTQNYGWCFYSPYIECPVCRTWHTYWFKTHFTERWIGLYLKRKWQLRHILKLESFLGSWPMEAEEAKSYVKPALVSEPEGYHEIEPELLVPLDEPEEDKAAVPTPSDKKRVIDIDL